MALDPMPRGALLLHELHMPSCCCQHVLSSQYPAGVPRYIHAVARSVCIRGTPGMHSQTIAPSALLIGFLLSPPSNPAGPRGIPAVTLWHRLPPRGSRLHRTLHEGAHGCTLGAFGSCKGCTFWGAIGGPCTSCMGATFIARFMKVRTGCIQDLAKYRKNMHAFVGPVGGPLLHILHGR
jgi:hypothetical protein